MKTLYQGIDYGKMIDEAMQGIVCQVLKQVEKDGLQNDHHFFITFATQVPGVKISKSLAKKYPKEITIVLQHQFRNLKVKTSGFAVSLSFNGQMERIEVPFSAILTFADPSVQFGLQFKAAMEKFEKETQALGDTTHHNFEDSDNVVSLAQFRKNTDSLHI